MADACPRCGAERSQPGSCPSCGYEPAHPGVLGAYREAAARLIHQPRLLVPFLVPAILLVIAQITLGEVEDPQAGAGAADAFASLASLFLVVAWYFLALAAIVRDPDEPPRLPGLASVAASLVGAAITLIPWSLIVILLVVAPQGGWGGLALLALVSLAIASVLVAGRTVGIPVQAAQERAFDREVLSDGNILAREHGGLGLVFLGLLAFLGVSLLPPLANVVLSLAVPSSTLIAAGGLLRWLLGAWIGVAIAIGLRGASKAPERSFTCPRCGHEASVKDGRASCGCGLEGPYYEA